MTYKQFEELPVWKTAIELAEKTDDWTRSLPKGLLTFSQRDQIERASLSVSNNIAEGFERGTTNELIAFLYIAKGSAGEVRSMLSYFENRPYLQNFRSEISNLKSLAASCSRQLNKWAEQLQNTDIQGPRRLDNRTRQSFERRKKAAQVEREMMARLPNDHPMRKAWEQKHGPAE